MALDGVPWYVGGGAEHSPSVARQLAYAATSGANGVTEPGDLKVTALPTAGASVRIGTGSGSIVNDFPGAMAETYLVRGQTSTDVAIAATGSGATVTKYIGIRVDDPQYPNNAAPANVANGPYVRPVVLSSIDNLAYPFLHLATITQPANTSTITNAMIKDERRLTLARESRRIFTATPAGDQTLTSSSFTHFPAVGSRLRIPEWATHIEATITVTGLGLYDAGVEGYFRVGLAPAGTADVSGFTSIGDIFWSFDAPAGGWPNRQIIIGGTSVTVPAAWKGKDVDIRPYANRTVGAGYLKTLNATLMITDVQISERIV